jgi:ribosomal protein L11 methyltransferase
MSPDRHRLVLPCRPEEAEVLAARLWALGALGVWDRGEELVAWFDEPVADVPGSARWELEPDRDWQAEWKATITPVMAGRFSVVPTWLVDQHRPAPDEEVLVLDPGRAFGSGHHATTAMCLELLDELDLADRTVADVGCGSGVLAIAAARRGARVVAVDIDRDAVAVTEENARRNEATLTARHGGVESLDGPVEVVVANLLTDTVAHLAEQLVGASRDVLVVSGITAERAAVALEPLRRAGMETIEVRERDGWIAVLGRSPQGDPTSGRGL